MTDQPDDIELLRGRVDALTEEISDTSDSAGLARLYIERAHCSNRLGDESKSVGDYLSALDWAEQDSEIVHAKSMIALAFANRVDQESQALFWAMGAVDQDPDDPEGRYILGLVCSSCGYHGLAIESLRHALRLQPEHWDAMRKLGACLIEKLELEEAIKTLSVYVSKRPHDPFGLYDLGRAIHALNRPGDVLDRARPLLERALAQSPPEYLERMIRRELGRLLEHFDESKQIE
ncbi:MAG: tetratricopeptide repeat protein [Gemmataceae bacterium]